MDEQLRIGDAERERAAADLGDHYAQGRLTVEEHAERLDRIWAARTRADLGPIFADLPGPAVAAAPARVRRRTGRPPRFPLLPLLVVVVVLAAVTPMPWQVGLVVLPLVAFVVVRRATWSRCGR
jgi:hypothetical protein